MRRWWENLLDIFPDFAVETVGVRDLEQVTLSAVLVRGHGVDSDTPFQMPIWQITRWREGKCTWWRSFATEADAL